MKQQMLRRKEQQQKAQSQSSKSHIQIYTEAKDNLTIQFKAYLNDTSNIKEKNYFKYCYDLSANPPSKTWFNGMHLPRRVITTISCIRSNHYNLNYSLHRKNLVPIPACDCGEGIQDINHAIFYCLLTIPHSTSLRQHLIEKFPQNPINIFTVLKQLSSKLCRLITAFLFSCNLHLNPPACSSYDTASMPTSRN